MPNFWHFSIILVEQWPLSEATFGHVLAAFAAVNFSLIQPETKRILGMSDDGLQPLEFSSIHSSLEYLHTREGSLIFYNTIDVAGRADIFASFRANPPRLILSVFHDLYADNPERVFLATMLEKIFIDLCHRLKPRYGYSSDDWTLEFILPSYGAFRIMQEFVDNIQTKRLPPIIFWLNYFGSPQDAEIMKQMVQISYRQRRVADCGTLVYLSDHPWTATQAVVGEDGFYHKVQ